MAIRRDSGDPRTPEQRAADESALREFEAGRFLSNPEKEREALARAKTRAKVIETWQDAIGTLATVKGYPNVVLRIKHVHADLNKTHEMDDIRPAIFAPPKPAAVVCEIVDGTPPESWEPCTPFGHYRVAAEDLCLEGESRV